MKIVAMHCTHMFPEQRHRIYACVCVRGAQPWVILCNPMDYSPSGSHVNGIYPSRILEYLYIYIHTHTHTHTYMREREEEHIYFMNWLLVVGMGKYEADKAGWPSGSLDRLFLR